MKIKKLITLASLLSTSIALASCSSSNMPYIGENGNWFVNGVDQGVSAQGPKGDQGDKGDKGDKGDQGNPGNTPYIGSNGNWWIGNTDTGIKVDYSGTISPEPEDSEKKERATELKSYINSLIEKTPNHVPA